MIKNILVIRSDRFGEFLLNIPAILALKKAYPQARICLAVNSEVLELAGTVECVDEVLIWDEIKGCLKRYGFDLGVVLNPLKEAHWAIFRAGIPVRVGYERKWGFLLTHKIEDTKHLGNRHEVECNLELVGLTIEQGQSPPATDSSAGRSGTVPVPVPSIFLNTSDSDKYKFLKGAVAIHPFTSDPVKQWPVERFIELTQRIEQEMKVEVVLVGKVEDRQHSLPWSVPLETMDLINKTSLVELAAVLKCCSLLVSCDSGPMHLAAAVGTPVVALFRNDLPGKTAKRWGPWGKGHTVIEKASLNDITVDEVFEKVKQRLAAY